MEGSLQKGNDFVGFIANEVLSIVENAGMMGVPMPSMIKKAVDILKDTAESGAR